MSVWLDEYFVFKLVLAVVTLNGVVWGNPIKPIEDIIQTVLKLLLAIRNTNLKKRRTTLRKPRK